MNTEKNHAQAWQKLSSFIDQGQKEHALGMFKLLAFSMDDKAAALKLHGDLLLSFDDPEAIKKYDQAAKLYERKKQHDESTAVYKLLAQLCPDEKKYQKYI